ncbi:hypothetical protein COCON_G00151110 [Conger conger]|uniref:Fibronectin type-III domain-containing protein n=1 Tax=Conger conger TaxID=82655 RepID=A0A9Q1D931_CONCO|nr:LIF receptor subunit alpha a [Conger conger]XP_061116258.1 LIF receptor subunit alpha a [Conger conger]XP_061116260.1 LIF receptor subunit alpha a [Conger conger]XP_061116261.1 LIF receptor subunit alpha a [Conger conger]KAJ8262654.1 hypothetical protein COCON_G00151110 [Conger conger]
MNSLFWWALLVALRFSVSLGQDGVPPPVPQGVRVEADFGSQVLSISWEKDPTSPMLYDVQVLRTELMEVVYNETIEMRADFPGKVYRVNWTSSVPLECTSHSVRLRSQHQQLTSEWSPLETVLGMDIPINSNAKMYPQDKVVPVGSNMTFCCIMKEGNTSGRFLYKSSHLPSVRLSRRSYACTVTNQRPSIPSGTNVLCVDEEQGLRAGSGAVVFVGFPPGDESLVCETRDLVSVECEWSTGRDTHLKGVSRQTYYTLNGRNCTDANKRAFGGKKVSRLQCQLSVTLEQGDRNWTLVAKNPLGTIQLTDTADLNHRVRPRAPLGVTGEVRSRNASLRWRWGTRGYATLPLECQVLVNSSEEGSRTFESSGRGLTQAVVQGLQPDLVYAARVRCRLRGALWKWGDWSSDYTLKTQEECADALDIWAWMDTNQTGYIKWKPLPKRQSHGQILGYQVTYGRPGQEDWQTLSLPPTNHSAGLQLGLDGDYIITVTARNSAGDSPPASITVPKFGAEKVHTPYKVYGSDGGFDLSWAADVNTTCGYVVEWHRTGKLDCNWEKEPDGNTSARIESESFEAGVQYSFSIYACTPGAPELLGRRVGYVKELAPAQHVSRLTVQQYGSDALLSWDEIPLEKRRGFICGYTIYISNGSHLVPIENISSPARNHTVKNLQPGSYKFTVKAYTSAGPDGGVTVSLRLDPSTDWLVGEILIALGAMSGFLILMTIICYKKRRWVKKTFYPEIPEPKLQEEWPTTPGMFVSRTLDVEPCPHNTVHIVENPERESGKLEPTVVLEDEVEGDDSSGDSSTDTDSSDPVVLRYYNQVVDDGSRGPPSTDSSASSSTSMASARTDVTYTGIQTSPCSSAAVAPLEAVQAGSYRPQMAPAPELQEPQLDTSEPADLPLLGGFGGYQPQSTWREDSPESHSLNCSLGSPTSVSSSQFLLPDPSAEDEAEHAPSTTWFHNLLSGKP